MSFSTAIYGANYNIEEVHWGRRPMTRSPDGYLHAVWPQRSAVQTGYYQVHYSRSGDDGLTWDAPTIFLNAEYDSIQACIACDNDSNLYVFWRTRYGYPTLRVMMRKYTKSTGTWGTPVEISTPSDETRTSPDINIGEDGIIHFSWCSVIGGLYTITYRNSPDGGVTFSSVEQLFSVDDRAAHSAYYQYPGIESGGWWDFPIADSDSEGNVFINYNLRAGSLYWRQLIKRNADGTWNAWEDAMTDYPVPGPYYNQIIGTIAVDSKDDIHISGHCIIPDVSTSVYNIRYKKRTAAGVWSAFTNITTEAGFSYNVPSIQFNMNDDFYITYRKAVTLGLNYYVKYDGSWGSPVEWTPADPATARSLSASPNQRWPNRTCIADIGFVCMYKRVNGSTNYIQFYNDWTFHNWSWYDIVTFDAEVSRVHEFNLEITRSVQRDAQIERGVGFSLELVEELEG